MAHIFVGHVFNREQIDDLRPAIRARQQAVAQALREWIPDVLNNAQTWMSEIDIGAGERWSPAIASALEDSGCGILCLTKSNLSEPWILFEAGTLAKSLKDTFVCPYLIDLEPSDVPQGPLAEFQAKRATRDGTLQLIQTLNVALGEHGISEGRLKRNFRRCWPDLELNLKAARQRKATEPAGRSVEAMVADILEIVRGWTLRTRSTQEYAPDRPPDKGLSYFRESGGRGEWLTSAEIEERLAAGVSPVRKPAEDPPSRPAGGSAARTQSEKRGT